MYVSKITDEDASQNVLRIEVFFLETFIYVCMYACMYDPFDFVMENRCIYIL